MRRLRIGTIVLWVFLLTVSLVGCGEKTEDSTVEPGVVTVSTPYGALIYQELWHEYMQVDQIEEGEHLRVSFCTEINDERYSLFDLVLGVSSEEAIGTITDEDGNTYGVSVVFYELEDQPALTEDEKNLLCAMQEEINFVMDNIK